MAGIDPIYISIKEAADALGVNPMTIYRLCDKQLIENRYQGRKRLVSVESLREYAADLPTTPPAPPESASA